MTRLRTLALIDEFLANVRIGFDEVGPPVGEFLLHFSRRSAQQQEIICSAKSRLLYHPQRSLACALFKTWLHEPDFAGDTGKSLWQRDRFALPVEHFLHRLHQRGNAVFTSTFDLRPALDNLMPEQAREQESG